MYWLHVPQPRPVLSLLPPSHPLITHLPPAQSLAGEDAERRWSTTALQGMWWASDVSKEGWSKWPASFTSSEKLSKRPVLHLFGAGGYSLPYPWLLIWQFLLLSSVSSTKGDNHFRKLCGLGKVILPLLASSVEWINWIRCSLRTLPTLKTNVSITRQVEAMDKYLSDEEVMLTFCSLGSGMPAKDGRGGNCL